MKRIQNAVCFYLSFKQIKSKPHFSHNSDINENAACFEK